MPSPQPVFYCLGILGTLAACEILGPPSALPAHAQQVLAPAEYQSWWAATEECSGRTGRMEGIEWYIVPDADAFDTPDGPKVGLWSHSSEGVRIIIAGNWADDELVVRHEMLHALLDQEGHPVEYFTDRCRLTWESWQGSE
jgi:hypothetical protein